MDAKTLANDPPRIWLSNADCDPREGRTWADTSDAWATDEGAPVEYVRADLVAVARDRPSAPEGVGLTRYDIDLDSQEHRDDDEGEWVRHEDAAAVIAAKEAEHTAWKAKCLSDNAAITRVCTEQIMRAETAEAERDALKATLPLPDDDPRWIMLGDLAPTYDEIKMAGLAWCKQLKRETFLSDEHYFRNNWSALSGLGKFVAREIAQRAVLSDKRRAALAPATSGEG